MENAMWMKSFSTADWIELHFNCTHSTHIHVMRNKIKLYAQPVVGFYFHLPHKTHSQHITGMEKNWNLLFVFPLLESKKLLHLQKTYLQSETERGKREYLQNKFIKLIFRLARFPLTVRRVLKQTYNLLRDGNHRVCISARLFAGWKNAREMFIELLLT